MFREQRALARAITVSAYGNMPNIRTAMNRGAFDFVTKPVDLGDIEITIQKMLDETGRVRELDRRAAVTMLPQFQERMTSQIFACGGPSRNMPVMREMAG